MTLLVLLRKSSNEALTICFARSVVRRCDVGSMPYKSAVVVSNPARALTEPRRTGEHATTFENCRLMRMISLTLLIPSKNVLRVGAALPDFAATNMPSYRGRNRERTISAPLLPMVRSEERRVG